jgi:RNA polymerase sigma-70 factor (ECF subfamily)
MYLRNKREAAEFYRTYRPKLLFLVRSKITNPHEAEDVVQDTLFAFLESRRDFHGECQISTFLFSICRHKIVDYYRKKKIKQIVFSRAPEIEDILSPLLGPEDALDAVLLKEKLNTTLRKLLPQYAYILHARYILNMPIDDIAKKLTTTIKSVEMTLFRARKAFIRAYEKVARNDRYSSANHRTIYSILQRGDEAVKGYAVSRSVCAVPHPCIWGSISYRSGCLFIRVTSAARVLSSSYD